MKTYNNLETDPINYIQPVIELFIITLLTVLLLPVLIYEKVGWLYRKARGDGEA
jgi:hypothetical protein